MQMGCYPALDDVQFIQSYRRLPPLGAGSGKGQKRLEMFVLIYIVLVCTFAYRVGRVFVEIYLLQKTVPLDSSHSLSANFTNIPSQVMRIIRCEGI